MDTVFDSTNMFGKTSTRNVLIYKYLDRVIDVTVQFRYFVQRRGRQSGRSKSWICFGKEILSVYDNESPWFYLFTHCSKMEQVERKLQEKFQTFIHKTVVYSRHKKCIMKEERPTISGLIFVKGECCHEIQAFLDRYLPGCILLKTIIRGKQLLYRVARCFLS